MTGHDPLRIGAKVLCTDGEAGRLDALVVDPVREAVTYLVVDERGRPSRRLVPVDLLERADADEVHLRCDLDELASLEPFDEYRYTKPEPGEGLPPSPDALLLDPGFYFLEPYAVPVDVGLIEGHERVPPDAIAFHRGSEVFSREGERLGVVDEFVVHPADGHVTHVVLRTGHVFRRSDVVIPVSSVRSFEQDKVELALTREEVERLPHIPTRRGRHLGDVEGGW